MTTATDDEKDRHGIHGFSTCRDCGGVAAPGVSDCFCEGNQLKARLAAAEASLAECDDELENASCPPMTNETIPERIARLAGLVSTTLRDEQTALEGKHAAEARAAEAERLLLVHTSASVKYQGALAAAEARCAELEAALREITVGLREDDHASGVNYGLTCAARLAGIARRALAGVK